MMNEDDDEEELVEDTSSLSCFPEIKGIVTRMATYLTGGSGASSRAGVGIRSIPVSLPRLTFLEKPYGVESDSE